MSRDEDTADAPIVEKPKKAPWWKFDLNVQPNVKLFVGTSIVSILALVCLLFFGYALPSIGMSPNGSFSKPLFYTLRDASLFGLLFIFLSIPVVAVNGALSLVHMIYSWRMGSRRWLVLSLVSLSTGIAFVAVWNGMRQRPYDRETGFMIVADNGNRIVEALESFHSENGVYPESLGELVPDYIDAIPSPGILACPEFSYGLREPSSYDDSAYFLRAGVRTHFINFDFLHYRADQNYGAGTPTYDRWAYFDN